MITVWVKLKLGKRKDNRPICTYSVYRFPHRVGGKCDGSKFTEYYKYNDGKLCHSCNCNNSGQCDVINGAESIQHVECYMEFKQYNSGEYLPLEFKEPEYTN